MKLKISYQPQFLEPPEAYAAVMEIAALEDGLSARLDIEYLGRNEVSEKELKEAGYTKDDDFHWTGHLHSGWNEEVKRLTQLELTSNPDSEIYFHLEIGDGSDGFPREIETADMLFQELLQAILEAESIEAPLKIWIYMHGEEFHLLWRFSDHTFLLRRDDNDASTLEWERGRAILKAMYSGDLKELKKRNPTANCFSPDQKTWYVLSTDAQKAIGEFC